VDPHAAKAAITRVDPVSQTIKVFAEIQGDAGDPMAGMSGRATSRRRNEPPIATASAHDASCPALCWLVPGIDVFLA